MQKQPIIVFLYASLLFGAAAGSVARADVATISLDGGNSSLSCCAGSYATVTVNRTDGTHATITFASDTDHGFSYLMGSNGAADLNVNGSYTLGPVTASNSIGGFNTASYTGNVPGTVDGFGTFDLSLNFFDGFAHTSTVISFTLTNTSGDWGSAYDVLTKNTSGFEAAGHVFACASPCTKTEGATATGFAANVPEPAAAVLLGSSLIAIGAIWRRRKRGCKRELKTRLSTLMARL